VSAHANLAEPPVEVALGAPERGAFAHAQGAMAPFRLAEPFERLRDLSDAFLQSRGARPKVYLAALGPESKHRRRVQFMREWLEVGGFEAVYDGETPTAEAALARGKESGALLVCLCGSDDAYAEQAEAFAKTFKASGAKGVALAGRPGEFERAWRAAGVEEFVVAGGDAVAMLQSLYRRIGVAPIASGIVTS
jgi:methylmalonyl-CoA mutase